MKRHKKAAAVLAAVLMAAMGVTACGSNGSPSAGGKDGYEKISAETAKERIDSGDDLIVLDVRTKEEYEEKHIPGALLIPNEEIGKGTLDQLPDKDQEILVYCRSGNRSAQAAEKLAEAGYINVRDFGGINDWPYDTEAGAAKGDAENEKGADKAAADKADKKDDGTGDDTAGGGVFGTFESETLDGEAITQEVFAKTDLTMVNIWGTFCGPCIREMPDLGELNRDYADKGFQIVGIVSDVTEAKDESALDIVEKTEADYTHIITSMDLYNGILGQIQVVPTTIFVDKEGKQVGDVYTGSRSKEDWAKIIDGLLKEV